MLNFYGISIPFPAELSSVIKKRLLQQKTASSRQFLLIINHDPFRVKISAFRGSILRHRLQRSTRDIR